jgi:hypothetical protein
VLVGYGLVSKMSSMARQRVVLPFVDVEVGTEIGRQCSCRRGATNGSHGEIVLSWRLLMHAHVTEVKVDISTVHGS